MEFGTWIEMLAAMIRKRLPQLEVFDRAQGCCFVAGQSSIDVVDARNGQAMIVPLKDPLRIVDGRPYSRHQGVALPRTPVAVRDETLAQTVGLIVEHLRQP